MKETETYENGSKSTLYSYGIETKSALLNEGKTNNKDFSEGIV